MFRPLYQVIIRHTVNNMDPHCVLKSFKLHKSTEQLKLAYLDSWRLNLKLNLKTRSLKLNGYTLFRNNSSSKFYHKITLFPFNLKASNSKIKS
jgi:hypothetical protein